jgi:hypothetical protein
MIFLKRGTQRGSEKFKHYRRFWCKLFTKNISFFSEKK